MKQKKLLAFLLALVMTVSVLSACGASSNKGVAMDAMAPEAPMENMKYEVADDAIYSSASTVSGDGSAAQTNQKLIRTKSFDPDSSKSITKHISQEQFTLEFLSVAIPVKEQDHTKVPHGLI